AAIEYSPDLAVENVPPGAVLVAGGRRGSVGGRTADPAPCAFPSDAGGALDRTGDARVAQALLERRAQQERHRPPAGHRPSHPPPLDRGRRARSGPGRAAALRTQAATPDERSEEHTSELQSR